MVWGLELFSHLLAWVNEWCCTCRSPDSWRREGGLWMRQQHPERVGCLTKRPRRQGQLDEKQTLRKFSMHASCSLKTQNTMVHMSEFHWDVRLKRIDALCIGQWSCLARRWTGEKKFVIEPSIPLICLCSDLSACGSMMGRRCQMTCLDFSSKRRSTAKLEWVESLEIKSGRGPFDGLPCLFSYSHLPNTSALHPLIQELHPPPLWNFVPLLVLWTDKFPLPLTQAPPPCTLALTHWNYFKILYFYLNFITGTKKKQYSM